MSSIRSIARWLVRGESNVTTTLERISADLRAAQLRGDVLTAGIDALAEREWRVTLANLAWQKVRDEIPAVQQQILALELDGVSRGEIAEQLDLPPNTVSVYKRRATARLQQEIRWLDSQWS